MIIFTVRRAHLTKTVKIILAIAPFLRAEAPLPFGAFYHPSAGIVFIATVPRLRHALVAVVVPRENAVYPAFCNLLINV